MGKNRITIGSRVFEHNDINSGNCYQTVSLLSESLEINYLEVDVQSADNLKSLPQDTPLTYFYDEKQVGIFYIQTVKRTGPTTYNIYAISTIGLLDKSDHYGGIYTGQTADEIIADICGSVPYIIKSNLKDSKLYGWLPIASRRDNLAQVLFALGAALKTDLDGVLRIEGLWNGLSGSIGKDQMYSDGNVDYGDLITGVSVTEHQYAEGGESVKLFEGTTQQGDIITFDEPVYSLMASGFTILESGANYAKVSSGSGTLTGNKYVHLTRELTRSISEAGTANVKTVKDATLVSLVNSSAVADRLKNYYKCREFIENDTLYLGERGGDVTKIYHPYDKVCVPVCLQEIDINLSNTLAANEKSLVGFTPPSVADIEVFDAQEVLTASGTWTVPEGVTRVRAVLIGGGDGGGGGSNGSIGESGTMVRTDSGGTGTKSGQAGAGGTGGQSGVPGSGGKVNIIDIEVTPGEALGVIIGTGGSAGAEDGQAGGTGTATSVSKGADTFSSEDGGSSSAGYVDVVTGTVYAAPGAAGKSGGDGGDGATSGKAAESGKPLSTNSGGSFGDGRQSTRVVDGLDRTPTITQNPWTSQVIISSGSTGYYSGYTGYSVDSDGRIHYSGSQKTIGSWGSQYITGTVYTNIRNNGGLPSNPSGNAKLTESIDEIECRGTGFYRRTLSVDRLYKYYKVNIATGTYGGGGGGAAFGGDGADGDTYGGGGANAIAPESATVPGSGGNAGNGGGGGGGGGGGYVSVTGTPGTLTYTAIGSGGSGGSAGKGSAGGKGANGAVLLYFGIPHIIKSGPVATANGRILLDSKGRMIVV